MHDSDALERNEAIRFLARFGQDQHAGRAFSLDHYLSVFPRCPDVIRQQYAEVTGEQSAAVEAFRIGRFVVREEIGRGGQAVVYRAEDTVLGRTVALKVIRGRGARRDATVLRLKREAEAASKLDHPGICSVYDVGEVEGGDYIAMRFVDGETLARRLARMRVEGGSSSSSRDWMSAAARLVEDVARALRVAHEAGLVHRDVKPANIMIDANERPVVLDFGLARDYDSDAATLTETGQIVGTPAFMAPEQLSSARLDRRTDVYALGVTLFQCLTGELPFEGATRDHLFHQIMNADPRDPLGLNPKISRDLRVVLATAMDKDPNRRYQTADALAEDLRRVRELEPILARPAGPVLRLRRFVKRRPAVTTLIAALVIGAPVVTVLLQQHFANRDKVLRAEAQERRDRFERALQEGYLALGDNDHERATELLERSLELEPESPEALAGLLRAARRQGNVQAALSRLAKHADLVKQYPDFDRIRVRLLREAGDADAADRVAGRLAPPSDAIGFFLAGEAAAPDCHSHDVAAFRKALGFYVRASLRSPDRALYFFERAHMAGHLRDAEEVDRVADVLVARWPDSFSAWSWRGQALLGLDDPRCLEALAKAAALRPTSDRARSNYGAALRVRGRLADAERETMAAIQLRPMVGTYHVNLGAIRTMRRDFDGAAPALERALTLLSPAKHAETHFNFGILYIQQKKAKEAVAAFRRALRDRLPDGTQSAGLRRTSRAAAHYNLGNLLRYTDATSAVDHYREALRTSPTLVEARVNLGTLVAQRGDREQAVKLLREAVAQSPSHAEALRNLAVMLLAGERLDEAIEVLERGLELRPSEPSLIAMHGIALGRNGDAIAALRALRRAAKIEAERKLQGTPTRPNLARFEKRVLRRAVSALRRGVGPESDAAERRDLADLLDVALEPYVDPAVAKRNQRTADALRRIARFPAIRALRTPDTLSAMDEPERAVWRRVFARLDALNKSVEE